MSRFKAGQSIVLDILDISDDGYYRAGNENQYWWFDPNDIDKVAEPLTDYTGHLQNKISNQAKSITSLLKQNSDLKRENAELKNKVRNMEDTFNTFKTSMCDACEHIDSVEKARAAGQNDAWELAKKISGMYAKDATTGSKDIHECFHTRNQLSSMMRHYTYTEAAAKVAEWERQNEICVGDVVTDENGESAVVTWINDIGIVFYIWERGVTRQLEMEKFKKLFDKTGRHIDVDAWLAQIGGESDE